jgi:tRNA(fMet)-specific endonuclease VapC
MRYLLDTNLLIAAMKKHARVLARMADIPLSDLVLSPIVLGELELGVAKSQHPSENAERLTLISQNLCLAPLDAKVSRHYGEIRGWLERQGTPIGANDYWIAAHARSVPAILATNNVREFSRVPELRVEDWMS